MLLFSFSSNQWKSEIFIYLFRYLYEATLSCVGMVLSNVGGVKTIRNLTEVSASYFCLVFEFSDYGAAL